MILQVLRQTSTGVGQTPSLRMVGNLQSEGGCRKDRGILYPGSQDIEKVILDLPLG